jgi:hypothetical protein
MPIMWRLHADRGDNPDPGIRRYIEKIVDEQRAIRQRTQFDAARLLLQVFSKTAVQCSILRATSIGSWYRLTILIGSFTSVLLERTDSTT